MATECKEGLWAPNRKRFQHGTYILLAAGVDELRQVAAGRVLHDDGQVVLGGKHLQQLNDVGVPAHLLGTWRSGSGLKIALKRCVVGIARSRRESAELSRQQRADESGRQSCMQLGRQAGCSSAVAL